MDDLEFGGGVGRIVRADLRTEAVLQGGDDAPSVGVVLGVGRGHQHDVEGQADGETTDLHVALLEDVEKTDLDPLGQVGQLVHGEDAAIGAGDQSEVQGHLVGQVATLGHLDGVDLSDEVGDGGVRRGQLLREAGVAVDPVDPGGVAFAVHHLARRQRHRTVGVVADLGPGDLGQPFVEQRREGPDDAGLGLATLAQEDDVMAGEQCILELREHGVLETEHPLDQRLSRRDPGGGVAPELLMDGKRLPAGRS